MSAHVGDLKGRPPSRAVLGALAVCCWRCRAPAASGPRRASRSPSRSPTRTSAFRSSSAGRGRARSCRLSQQRRARAGAAAQRPSFLADYRRQKADRLLIKAPSGGASEQATMRAMEDVRSALRQAGIPSRTVMLEPYYANGDPPRPCTSLTSAPWRKAPNARTGRRMSAAIRRTCPIQFRLRHPGQFRRHARQPQRSRRAAHRDAAFRRAPRRGLGQVRERPDDRLRNGRRATGRFRSAPRRATSPKAGTRK